MSMRNQDWLIKINYANGTGDGTVLWRLGQQGDFTMTGTSNAYPWFTHQHDAEFNGSGTQFLTVFDNGNTRITKHPGEKSRGQVLSVDEANKTVALTLNYDLGTYSPAIGSAQRLANGNYSFDSGWVASNTPNNYTEVSEVLPSGTLNYLVHAQQGPPYRAWRMVSLYQGDPSGL